MCVCGVETVLFLLFIQLLSQLFKGLSVAGSDENTRVQSALRHKCSWNTICKLNITAMYAWGCALLLTLNILNIAKSDNIKCSLLRALFTSSSSGRGQSVKEFVVAHVL